VAQFSVLTIFKVFYNIFNLPGGSMINNLTVEIQTSSTGGEPGGATHLVDWRQVHA